MFMYAAVRLLGAVLTFWLAVTLTFFGLRAAFARSRLARRSSVPLGRQARASDKCWQADSP